MDKPWVIGIAVACLLFLLSVCLCLKTLSVRRSHDVSFENNSSRTSKGIEQFASVQVPKEMTRDFTPGVCTTLQPDPSQSDAKAIVMASTYLDSGRLVSDAKDAMTCYMLQDEGKAAVDVLMRGFECSKDSVLFKDNPLFKEVTFDPSLVNSAGYSIATGKCKMVLNPDEATTANLNAFWTQVGSSHCENYMAAMIREYKLWIQKHDTLLAKQKEKLRILEKLSTDVRDLQSQVQACDLRVKGKSADYQVYFNGGKTCNAAYTKEQAEFVSFKSACMSRITVERERLKELSDLLYKQSTLLKEQEDALGRLRTRLAEVEESLARALATKNALDARIQVAETELADLRRKVAELIQEISDLSHALKTCQEMKERLTKELATLRAKLSECDEALRVCTSEYVPAAQAEAARLQASVKEKKDIIEELNRLFKMWQDKYKTCDPQLTQCRAEDKRILDEIEELKKRLYVCESSRTVQSAAHQERLMDLTARLTEKKLQAQADIDASACSRPVKEFAEPTNQYQALQFVNTVGSAPQAAPAAPAAAPPPAQEVSGSAFSYDEAMKIITTPFMYDEDTRAKLMRDPIYAQFRGYQYNRLENPSA